jgi:hypothetical protein
MFSQIEKSAAFLQHNHKLKKAREKVDKLQRHKRMLKTQRKFLEDLERKLPPKSPGCFHIIVFEDFVAQYNFRGQKVTLF